MARPKAHVNRREDILKIAQKLFRENGFEKTTVDDIAHNSGISKGSVYLEFKTKEDIFYYILENYLTLQFDKFSDLVECAKPPYLLILKDFFVNDALSVFDLMGGGYKNCEAMIYTNEEIKAKFMPLIEKWGSLAFELVKKAKGNGEVNENLDCESVSKILDIGVSGFYPPYSCNIHYSKEYNTSLTNQDVRNSIEKDLSHYLDILFSGLRYYERTSNEE